MEGIKQLNTQKIKTAQALQVAENSATVSHTGVNINFQRPGIYNSSQFPGSGNFSWGAIGGEKIGMVQRIYHFANTYEGEIAPTFPSNWLNVGPGTYDLGAVNIIEAQWVGGYDGTRIEYSFVQPTLLTNTLGWSDTWNDGHHSVSLWTSQQGSETDPVYAKTGAGYAGEADMIIKGIAGTTVWVKVIPDYYPHEFTITYTDSAGAPSSHTAVGSYTPQTFTFTIS